MTILCYGEIDLDIYVALDRLPTMEKSATCSEDFENVGGAAANSALWLANWGLPTRLAGHDLGDDRAGDEARAVLAAQPHLDTRFIARHADYRTPRCQCLVTPDGERSFITHWPLELLMTPPAPEMLDGVEWVNLDMSGPLPLRLQMAKTAAQHGIPVLVNDIYSADNPLLPLIDILVISAAIVRSRAPGRQAADLAQELQRSGDCHVIITNAGEPLTVISRAGERHRITPPPVEAVDTTGAGDIFKSGLLYGLLQGLPLAEAARWGAAAGSLMCRVAGTTHTLAPLSAVEALLDAATLETGLATEDTELR
ncbi:MAG: carbohydrate kinase family protein [Chloroflexi bacterium]|nr:carbohydrate kinase family protein [Chloroflexota bacterium]